MKKEKGNKKILIMGIIGLLILSLVSIAGMKILKKALKVKSEETYKLIFEDISYIDFKDKNFKALEILENDLANTIFLAGEIHETIKSKEMQIYMIEYMVKKVGVKYIILEQSYTVGQRLNEYINSGDEDILNELKEYYKKYRGQTEENYELYRKIYEFNKDLSDENKIKLIGIDTEMNHNYTVKYLKQYIPKEKKYPKEIEEFVKKLKQLKELKNVVYNNEAKEMLEIIEKNQEDFKNYYKDDYFDITFILNNLANSFFNINRDEHLYNNLIKIYEELPEGKYFGQFGRNHVYKEKVIYDDGNEYESLAYYLDKNYEKTKGRVITIGYDYIKSETSYDGEEAIISNYLMSELFHYDGETIMLKAKSNYDNTTIIGYSLNQNYFDYYVLLSNSKKQTPLN